MDNKTKLFTLMTVPLPPLDYQKNLQYEISLGEVVDVFYILNETLFDDKLKLPTFDICSTDENWGYCAADEELVFNASRSSCTLALNNNWYCKQWFISILAHEMCHQYQVDILSKQRVENNLPLLISHGPTFFMHRNRLMQFGIPLKKTISISTWFKCQELLKC